MATRSTWIALVAATAWVLLAGSGCGSAVHRENGTDADSDADGDTDTDVDADTDVDSDVDADSDSDTDTDVDQGPVTFVLLNETDERRYVDSSRYGVELVSCRRRVGGEWTTCGFEPAFCTVPCDHVETGDYCCMDCDYMPGVYVIEPGGTFEVGWGGDLFELDADHCRDCECSWRVDPSPGRYRAVVDAWSEVECWDACPEPTEDGAIWGGRGVGEVSHPATEFDVLYEGEEIIIPIAE